MGIVSGLAAAGTAIGSAAASTAGAASSIGAWMAANSSWLLPVAGGVVGAGTAIPGMVSGIQSAEYQKEVANANQKMYEEQARQTEEQGEWEKRQQSLRQAAQTGRFRASAAASGAALGSGSLLDWEASNAETNMIDNANLDYDIKMRAYQAKLGAWNAEAQSNLAGWQKNMAVVSGVTGSVGGAMQGAVLGSQLNSAFNSPGTSQIDSGNFGDSATSSNFGQNPMESSDSLRKWGNDWGFNGSLLKTGITGK